jgi:hypothetical protein
VSVIFQCLIVSLKPFDSKAANIISFYNEVAVSLYLYSGFPLSDYLDTQFFDDENLVANLRLNFAWVLAGILILTIFINFAYTLVKISILIFKFLKAKVNCKKILKFNCFSKKAIIENVLDKNNIASEKY